MYVFIDSINLILYFILLKISPNTTIAELKKQVAQQSEFDKN